MRETKADLLRWAAAWRAVVDKRAQIVEGRMAVIELISEIDRLIETYGSPNSLTLKERRNKKEATNSE